MSIHERVLACAFHCRFIFPLDTPISVFRCAKYKFISKPETSQGRQCQRSPTGSARAIIFSTASDQISPTKTMEEVSTISSTSRSHAVKRRTPRKSPFRRIVCRDSLIQFSRSHLLSFRKYRFLRRRPPLLP